jgi:hypothetical protein
MGLHVATEWMWNSRLFHRRDTAVGGQGSHQDHAVARGRRQFPHTGEGRSLQAAPSPAGTDAVVTVQL